ncbi:hypothetical protein [Sagittula sp. S175]|uniref:hypothetical protein n=1 Tax=Sagittula sp. S175 TaxID=3415129 RepID=UPI003C7AF10E
MTVSIHATLGRYNLASDEKQWQLSLRTPFGNVSEFFPEGEKPEADTVEDALDLISARLESYFYTSRREEGRAKISAIRENLTACELILIDRKIDAAREQLKRLEDRRARFVAESAE